MISLMNIRKSASMQFNFDMIDIVMTIFGYTTVLGGIKVVFFVFCFFFSGISPDSQMLTMFTDSL